MNKLVEYLTKYHNPGGNSVNIVPVDDLIFEMELTRREIFELASDPAVKNILSPKFSIKDWINGVSALQEIKKSDLNYYAR